MITVVSVGKKHEQWVSGAVKHYQDRLKKPFDIDWVFLPHSSLQDDIARQDESERILSRLNGDDFVILLDEAGKAIDSPALSKLLGDTFVSAKKLTIIIGGAYGVDERLHDRAGFVWSLSPLVFPHQLVRLILTEQIYRAQQISMSHPYHHQ